MEKREAQNGMPRDHSVWGPESSQREKGMPKGGRMITWLEGLLTLLCDHNITLTCES